MNKNSWRNYWYCMAAGLILTMASFGVTIQSLPPCPTEDSSNCRWDAKVQGNGEGRSFIDLNGWVIYL